MSHVIVMIPRSELTAAQREIGRLKDHVLYIEADLAKERAEAERVKEKLAQEQEEIRRLREIVASYAGQ